MDKRVEENIVQSILNNNEFYKNNEEAVERLKKSLKEVEVMEMGKKPKRSARFFVSENRKKNKKF